MFFANRYNSKGEAKDWQSMRNPQFRAIQQQNRSAEFPLQHSKSSSQQNWREKVEKMQDNGQSSSPVEHMDIDKTSTAVNVERNQGSRKFEVPFKREFSKNNTRASFNQQQRTQRLNNVQGESDYARTILEDEHADINDDVDFCEPANYIQDETSSIFLGE